MTRSSDTPPRVLVLRCDCPPPTCEAAENALAPEARAFDQVITVIETFCPKVEILRPGTCALDVRAPARYFGGELPLAAQLIAAISQLGRTCQIGIADGLFAAHLAARPAPQPQPRIVPPGETPAFLAPQPIAALDTPDLTALLPKLGITTLGQFAAIPPAEAATRFGTPGTLAHRLARGLDPRPLAPRPPPADLSVHDEFDPPAEQSDPVVFAAKSLAEHLHARLAASGLACVRLQIQVHCEDGRDITRFWRHDGLLSGLAVAERVRWQLDGWRAGQPAGTAEHGGTADEGTAGRGGITLLRLVPDQLVRATGRQLALWGDALISDRVARCAVRVQAMLGPGAVTRPVLAGGRRPAEQVFLVPFGDAQPPPRPADRPWPGQIPAPAPATVYPVPLAALVTDDAGAVVTVTGRAGVSAPPAWLTVAARPALAITSWAGPWPVTEQWWDPAHARRQARFQLVAEDGSAWLAVLQDGRWLIEARYD